MRFSDKEIKFFAVRRGSQSSYGLKGADQHGHDVAAGQDRIRIWSW